MNADKAQHNLFYRTINIISNIHIHIGRRDSWIRYNSCAPQNANLYNTSEPACVCLPEIMIARKNAFSDNNNNSNNKTAGICFRF